MLAKKYHPDAAEQKTMDDVTLNSNNEKFIKVKEAYDKIFMLNHDKAGTLF